MSELWEKELWMNPNIMYLFNSEIIEYDIKEAGYSIVREFNQLDEKKLNKLSKLSKDSRHKQIGVYMRDDHLFAKEHKKGFQEARRRFYSENSLDEDNILSIKKDAIFVMGHVDTTQVGDYIDFRNKNRYSSYIRLPNKIELYYSDGNIDVKGISKSTVDLHDSGIMEFLKNIFHVIESADKPIQLRMIMRYINAYKFRELPVSFYREFNADSKIVLLNPDENIAYDDYWEDRKDELSIHYNYYNVFIPILKMII